jgi:hypothetical protein
MLSRLALAGLLLFEPSCLTQEQTRIQLHDPSSLSVQAADTGATLIAPGTELADEPVHGSDDIEHAVYPRITRTSDGQITKTFLEGRSPTPYSRRLLLGNTVRLTRGALEPRASFETRGDNLVLHEGDVDMTTPWSNVARISKTTRPDGDPQLPGLAISGFGIVFGPAMVTTAWVAPGMDTGDRIVVTSIGTGITLVAGLLTWVTLSSALAPTKTRVLYPARKVRGA